MLSSAGSPQAVVAADPPAPSRLIAHGRLIWEGRDGHGWSSERGARHLAVFPGKAKEMLENMPRSEAAPGSKDRERTGVGGGDSEAKCPRQPEPTTTVWGEKRVRERGDREMPTVGWSQGVRAERRDRKERFFLEHRRTCKAHTSFSGLQRDPAVRLS